VEFVTFLVIVQAMLEYCVSGFWGKWDPIPFAESYEYGSAWFLIVREVAMVVVFSFQRAVRRGDHSRSRINVNINAKINGQECPFHTSRANPTSIAEPPAFVCDE
jgi:hypothetical protein